jgi:hypothetical protein
VFTLEEFYCKFQNFKVKICLTHVCEYQNLEISLKILGTTIGSSENLLNAFEQLSYLKSLKNRGT